MHDLSGLSDDDLVRLCRERGAGDERPFAELYRRHRELVWAICRRYFRDPRDAADLVQETFFRAYRSLGSYAGGHPSLLRAWLARIAANVCKNELRTRSRRPRTVEELLAPEAASPAASSEETLVTRARLATLRRALATLAPAQREILELADLEQIPYAELARRLGVSLSGVKMRVVRARASLGAAYRDLDAKGNAR